MIRTHEPQIGLQKGQNTYISIRCDSQPPASRHSCSANIFLNIRLPYPCVYIGSGLSVSAMTVVGNMRHLTKADLQEFALLFSTSPYRITER